MADKTRRPLEPRDNNGNYFKTVLAYDPKSSKADIQTKRGKDKGGVSPIDENTQAHAQTVAPKRKACEMQDPEDIQEIDSDDDRLRLVTENCDQIRRKIRNFLNTGEMKVGEFVKAIGGSQISYSRFMAQNGKDKGFSSDTYVLAFAFFKKRELEGIKIPKKKVKKGEEKNDDVSSIHLVGEAEVAVPVYDNCDEIRRKISVYLREPGITQAAFLRNIAKTYSDGRKIQSKVLNDFLSKKGASSGNTSSVFYSSYVFFEKLRLRDGKDKSRHRLEMEAQYARDGGIDVKSRSREYGWYIVAR